MGVEQSLWRALAVFRVFALAYAIARFAQVSEYYRHPAGGWAVMALLTVWTAATSHGFRNPLFRRPALLITDVAIAVGCVLATRWLDDPERVAQGTMTLPTVWSSAPVLACAIKGGWRTGAIAALAIGGSNVLERGALTADNQHNTVLLLLAGGAVGYVVEIAKVGESALARALRLEAATRERERLARDIHDGVLQVLALVQRRGAELGGEAAGLGRLAGEQEAALRRLVSATPAPVDSRDLPGADGEPARADLRVLLGAFAGARVTVSAPGTPVTMPTASAREVTAAVAAALDNVRRHAGEDANAWILVEDEGEEIVVSVRDDGPGMAPGRLETARAQGRLGVAQSIEGRVRDLGGSVVWSSVTGEGTELEFRVPRVPRQGSR